MPGRAPYAGQVPPSPVWPCLRFPALVWLPGHKVTQEASFSWLAKHSCGAAQPGAAPGLAGGWEAAETESQGWAVRVRRW
jgi:hypothetical protein